jgi:translation initiation factor IF-1
MVKNTSGGTKTKGLARKHIRQGGVSAKLRIPENELEKVVYVSKMLGNGMCEVYTNDNIRLIAHIRNKFKGRQKRSNTITANSYILIGLRDWENPYKNCDVIFVYDETHFKLIRDIPSIPINNIIRRAADYTHFTNNTLHDELIFTNTLKQEHEHEHEHEQEQEQQLQLQQLQLNNIDIEDI